MIQIFTKLRFFFFILYFKGKGLVWYCISRLNYKNLPISSISFSQDGSLLAAGCGNTLCIWNTENSKLKCSLSTPSAYDGATNKIILSIASNIRPHNGVKSSIKKSEELEINNAIEKRKKILEQIKELLNGNNKNKSSSNQFVRNIKKDKIKYSRKIKLNKISKKSLNIREKELIFKKIINLDELNLYQKFEIFSFLKISCRTTDEIRFKLLDILNKKNHKQKYLENKIDKILMQLTDQNKFLLKRKLYEYKIRRNNTRNYNFNSIVSGELIKRKLSSERYSINGTNGNVEEASEDEDDDVDDTNNNSKELPIKTISQINHVLFGTKDFGHLVIVCTENRLLVWNLLTLRLQTSVKISVDRITIDPYTNLIAAFTIYNNCKLILNFFNFFVFK